MTFHGFVGDDSSARLVAPAALEKASPPRKVEFLGDSITAGFDNQCDIPGSPKGFPWSESFGKSWATLICDELDAECHYNAWSGFGMVSNCCMHGDRTSDATERLRERCKPRGFYLRTGRRRRDVRVGRLVEDARHRGFRQLLRPPWHDRRQHVGL